MQVISFFSFKGGVGRTGLLTNVGAQWAREGKVVLLIDLDLSAPGLTYHPSAGKPLFSEGGGRGISDVLAAFHRRSPGSDEVPVLPPHLLLREMNIPRDKLLHDRGRLLLIDAGRSLGEYTGRQASGDGQTGIAGAAVLRDIPRPTPSTEEAEEHDVLAFRSLAQYIREDLLDAAIPALHDGGEVTSIDYVLIDCRTGFPELLDLSLGYLSDRMVLVSGLNDQNLEGMKATLKALHKRVPVDTLPAYLTVVLSPVPVVDEEATYERLRLAHDAMGEALRRTRHGIKEQPPETLTIHYTHVMALREAILVLERPESIYAREVRDIVRALEGADREGATQDVLLQRARSEALAVLREPKPVARQKRPGPTALDFNPIAELPPWHWPIDNPTMRASRMEALIPPRTGEQERSEREELLNLVCWTISLPMDMKRQVLASFPLLNQEKLHELRRILAEDRRWLMDMWVHRLSSRDQLFRIHFQHQKDWARFVTGDAPAADAAFLDHPFLGENHFKGWELWPMYWLLLAEEGLEKQRGEPRFWDAVERALELAGTEGAADCSRQIFQMFERHRVGEALWQRLEQRVLAETGRAPEALLGAAQEHVKAGSKTRSRGLALLAELADRMDEGHGNAQLCFRTAALILDHATELVPRCQAILERSIELDPEVAAPWYGLGNLFQYHLGRYAEAEGAYRKAIDLDPKFAYPWNNLGELLQNHLARYAEAEAAYRKAIELDPKFAPPWNNLGNLLQNHLARYAEAEAAYRNAIDLDPKLAQPWTGLGELLQNHLARYAEAEAAYRNAIDLDPKLAQPWTGLGELLHNHLARYAEAEAAYRKAIDLDPKLAQPWNGLGNLLQDRLGRYAEAEVAYRKAIDLDPKLAKPWNNLGNLLQGHLARYAEAEAAYRKAIDLDPNHAAPWFGLGLLKKYFQQNYSEARHAFENGIHGKLIGHYCLMNMGFLLKAAGDHLGAQVRLAQASADFDAELQKRATPDAHGLANLLRLSVVLGKQSDIERLWAASQKRIAQRAGVTWLRWAHFVATLALDRPQDVASVWEPVKTQLKSHYEAWTGMNILYEVAGFRPEARTGARQIVAELLSLPDEVCARFKDCPIDDTYLRVLHRFAEGKSTGLGDPGDWELLFPGQPRPEPEQAVPS